MCAIALCVKQMLSKENALYFSATFLQSILYVCSEASQKIPQTKVVQIASLLKVQRLKVFCIY